MLKVLMFVVGALVVAGVIAMKHHQPGAPADPRADDGHPVHIAMGGHDFVIPRYFLVTSPGDDAKLENVTRIQHGHPGPTQIASFSLLASLPSFAPVAAKDRSPPYGTGPDDKIQVTVTNEPPIVPTTLVDYAAELQRRNVNYTTTPGPFGLMQEDDDRLKAKTKLPAHHYFGALYGGQLMITCVDEPGLGCSFDYPLGSVTATIAFSHAELAQWPNLYPAAAKFVLGFRRD